jgi:hypothetical protein
MKQVFFLLVLLVQYLILPPEADSAGSPERHVLSDVAGIVVDPLKIERGSENVLKSTKIISASLDRTLLQLKQLQEKTDLDIRSYLAQIDEIVTSVNSTIYEEGQRVEQIILTLADKAESLENQAHQDAIDLIWRVQCAIEVTATDTVQRALADALNSIRASEPTFVVFGIPTGKLNLQPVDIKDPDIVYRAIKKKRLQWLNEDLTENDDAYIIRSAYLNLARLSKLTQCHYIGHDSEVIFIRDYYEFERLSMPWNRVVRIED